MTEIQGHHEDDCLMCAVRALTQGRAKEWIPEEPEEITGVVLRQGTQPSAYGAKPFIELWLGGRERRRVTAYSGVLESLLDGGELEVGDTATVRYIGKREAKLTPSQEREGRAPNQYKVFELEVQRGHR
jgi:hypothetical protein